MDSVSGLSNYGRKSDWDRREKQRSIAYLSCVWKKSVDAWLWWTVRLPTSFLALLLCLKLENQAMFFVLFFPSVTIKTILALFSALRFH